MENLKKKLTIFGIVTLSSLFFSSGLSGRVKSFDSDFFYGKNGNGENKSKNEIPSGTFPGFIIQLILLILISIPFKENNDKVRKIKNIIFIFSLSGYSFALGATNLSNMIKNKK